MIPQNLTSPPSLSREFFTGNSKGHETNVEGATTESNRLSEPLKNCLYETEESIVRWKQKNIKDGFVIVDEAQLSKLIKREPIEKYYKLEQEPFAK
ncbi:hypothetical protein RUM43_013594 [Polyplax serrata]|uniref:Uncharacterized protein n=1 Tax=Polyplax serrata TaxID=468196 RepID=A0AAN8P1V3_POLSC